MSFILAIQLFDGLIVAADQKKMIFDLNDPQYRQAYYASKIHVWEQGLITGVGEGVLIAGAVNMFRAMAHPDLNHLPSYLSLARQLRVQDLGRGHEQLNQTRVFCSQSTEHGAQLYKIEAEQPYRLHAFTSNTLGLLIFKPNIDHIAAELEQLYAGLRSFASFASQQACLNYYLAAITEIFYLQHLHDLSVSQSFDVVFQSADQFLSFYMENSR